MQTIIVMFGLLYVFSITIIYFILRNVYNKREKKAASELVKELQKKLESVNCQLYCEINSTNLNTIKDLPLEKVQQLSKLSESYLTDYEIVSAGETLILKKDYNKEEIEHLKQKLDEVKDKIEKQNDTEYYFYKELMEKLTFILNEIGELYTETREITNLNIKFKTENIKDKVQFLLEFLKEKGTLEYHKYNLYNITNLVTMLDGEFENKLKINFYIGKDVNAYYIEIDKLFSLIKTIIYSVIKQKIGIHGKELDISIEHESEMIVFIIKNEKDDYNFSKLVEEEFLIIDQVKRKNWQLSVQERKIIIEVPIKSFEGDETEEVKSITLSSNLSSIKEAIKVILYEMNKYGFSNEEIYDMRLALDEIIVNAIEHGNKFDESKQVLINYKVANEGKKIIVEVEDQGDGFDIDNVKEPDILSSRGRGIAMIKMLVNEVMYMNNGTKVILKKDKEV